MIMMATAAVASVMADMEVSVELALQVYSTPQHIGTDTMALIISAQDMEVWVDSVIAIL